MDQEKIDEVEQAISINSIDLDLMTDEQKEIATEKIMRHIDFESFVLMQVEEVIQTILIR